MRIQLKRDAFCGKVFIAAGDYWVALSSESSTIELLAGGKTIKLPAVRRRSAARTKHTTVSLTSGGGRIWSIAVSTPKHGEWVSMIEYERE